MIIYVYDGSFEGLLTAIHEAYYLREKPDKIISEENFRQDLLSSVTSINTAPQKADKVYNAIVEKISREALRFVYYVYISEVEEAATVIYEYLKMGWKVGYDVDKYLLDPRVLKIHQISSKVSRERHRMLGLLRFQSIGELYYSEIEPDYNIVGLIAPHFAKRMADQSWMIHDSKRNIAAVYNQREWYLIEVAKEEIPPLEDRETVYEELWRAYYKHISIPERANSRLQKRCMPVRYWKHLTEIKK